MLRKVISVITIIVFILPNFNCYTSKEKSVARIQRRLDYGGGTTIKILGVVTKSGEIYEFPMSNPAKFSFNVEYDAFGAVSYSSKDTVIGITIDSVKVKIPTSSIDQIHIKKMKGWAIAGIVVPSVIVVCGLPVLIWALTKYSCPFIYSYDGEEYRFDAEPYGGAICEGLKRTEWCTLEHLKETDGTYKIKITNEVDETQYTDELKLVVIDHPEDVKVVPDVKGGFHTFSEAQAPVRAYNSTGKNILPYVKKNDWIYWHSFEEDIQTAEKKNFNNELIFEFSKPLNVQKVKLMVNACSTLWGSQMLKRYLELAGSEVDKWYEEMNSGASAEQKNVSWAIKDQLYALQVMVETKYGWKEKGMIQSGGPFISEDKAYVLDVSDVENDILRIKLTPPLSFWKINFLGVDYSKDIPVTITEVEALEAVDSLGNNIRALYQYEDRNYHIMPDIGNSAELVFPSPPQSSNTARTIIAKACGYYDIHLDKKGHPRISMLRKLKQEQNFSVEISVKEYRKWEKSLK